MVNGNGNKWMIWMAGIIGLLVLGSIGTVSANVITNDKASRARDTSQVKDIASTQADIREIKTSQTYMQRDIDHMRMEQKTGFEEIKDLLATR